MNQGMAGLIIGAVFGLILGFFLAPTESANIPGVDSPDLACLEDRQALAAEVRNSLARMADAGCGCGDAPLEPLPAAQEAPRPTVVQDGGTPLEALTGGDQVERPVPITEIEVPADRPSTGSQPIDAGPLRADATKKLETTALSPPPTDNASLRQWMVQLIATPDENEAKRIAKQAQVLLLPTVIDHEMVPALGRKLYKVRVGPFATKLEGKEAMKTLKDGAGISDCWLHPRR